MRHDRDKWVRIERSGRFLIVIQRKEKRKEVNKVRRLTKYGHNTAVISSSALGSFSLCRLASQTVEGAGIQIVSFVASVEHVDTPSALG